MSPKNVLVFALAIVAIGTVAFVGMGKPVEAPAHVATEDASGTAATPDEAEVFIPGGDADFNGWVRMTTDAFTIDVPRSWIVESRPSLWGDDRIRGIYTYGWLYNEQPDDAYTDLDVVTVRIDDITYEEGRTYDSIVDEYACTKDELQSLSDVLKREFNDPDAAPSIDEITYAESRMSLDGRPTTRILLGSDKPLYIEGGAETNEWYVIDANDRAFVLTVNAASTEGLDAFLELGRSIVHTVGFK